MNKYTCEKCGKEFKQKSHYDTHINKKNPCINELKIKELVNKVVDEKIKKIKKKLIIESESDINSDSDNDSHLITKPKNMKKQTTGLKRNTTDKYYTNCNIVNYCFENIKKYIQINKNDLIIEPSAGNGAFIKEIKNISSNYLFYDIEPEHNDIIKQDYLSIDYSYLIATYPSIHIIGNPPFGRQSSLAIKFIKKSCQFCNTISFILPKSFKKESLKKIFPLNFHLKFEVDLPEKSFLVEGEQHNVPCIFQIWQKSNENRLLIKKLEPINFIFIEKSENPDISFRRVGVYAGKIDKNIIEKSIQSHYFIKFTNNKNIDDNIELLKSLHFNHNNTVGPRSISKQELIKQFNQLLN
jgi:hypothetical protein